MRQTAQPQMSERFLLGALLAVSGGYLDAYTFLMRGAVFANAQTGNIVLLGIHLIQGQLIAAGRYLVPILAFAAGVVAAEAVRKAFHAHPSIHWRQIIVGVEALMLAGVSFLPQSANTPANLLVSFVCAMQVESFRKVNGNAFATTMCTGNLRSCTELLFRYFSAKDKHALRKSLQYLGIILFFILGAAFGALGAGILAERAVLVCCFLLLCAFGAMFFPAADADGKAEQ